METSEAQSGSSTLEVSTLQPHPLTTCGITHPLIMSMVNLPVTWDDLRCRSLGFEEGVLVLHTRARCRAGSLSLFRKQSQKSNENLPPMTDSPH